MLAYQIVHNIMLFRKGILTLSHISGHEHKKVCSFLLGLIVDLLVSSGQISSHVIRAVYMLMDFLFLAQCKYHISNTISKLENSLFRFLENKEVFIDFRMWDNFCSPSFIA